MKLNIQTSGGDLVFSKDAPPTEILPLVEFIAGQTVIEIDGKSYNPTRMDSAVQGGDFVIHVTCIHR